MPESPPAVLVINAGSSTVRLASVDPASGSILARTTYDVRQDQAAADHARELARFGMDGILAVLHRVVHGGPSLTAPCAVTAAVEAEITRIAPLAPLHNPLALDLIRASRGLGPATPQIAVFDTAFFRDLPEAARTYAIPAEWRERHGIRRFGFHGLAHESMLFTYRSTVTAPPGRRVISLQLGGGCSMTASLDGRPVDTSMGFSPLEGLVMATRSGDVDPGALLHLLQEAGLNVTDLDRGLTRDGGLAGLSGQGSHVGRLLASREPAAQLALDVYCHRIRRYLGAFLAVLGGADAILFGGGVGENAPAIRERVLAGLGFAGIHLDRDRNAACIGRLGAVHEPGSPVDIWVVPVDETGTMFRAARHLVPDAGSGNQPGDAP